MRAYTVFAASLLATALIVPFAAADSGDEGGGSDPSNLPGLGKCIHINPDLHNPIDIYDCPVDTNQKR